MISSQREKECANPAGPKQRCTFFDEPPGTEENILKPEFGEIRVILEVGIQPSHQGVDCGMTKTEGSCGKHIGDCGIHSVVIAFIDAHMLLKGLGAQNFGEVISHSDDLWRKKTSEWFRTVNHLCAPRR